MHAFKLYFACALAATVGCSAAKPGMENPGPDAGVQSDPGGYDDPGADAGSGSDPTGDPDPGYDPDPGTDPGGGSDSNPGSDPTPEPDPGSDPSGDTGDPEPDLPQSVDVTLVSGTIYEVSENNNSWDFWGGKPDAKVFLTVAGTVYDSSIQKNTLAPFWNELLAPGVSTGDLHNVTVEMVDHDSVTNSDSAGVCSFTLSDADLALDPDTGAGQPFTLECPRDLQADPKIAGFTVTLRLAAP